MARTPIIAGNWKMNNTIAAGVSLVKELIPLVKDAKVTVVACPTATALAAVADAVKGTNIHIGAQNVHWEKSGAYTGELSTDMLKEIGVDYVILGHSERRDYFGETDEGVNKRARAAYAAGITPIICCGESLAIREAGTYIAHVVAQINAALEGFTADEAGKLVIAYEPIWSIGPGKIPADAAYIQKIARFVKEKTKGLDLVYGGGLKTDNARMLAAIPEIDGGLIALTRFSGEIGFYPREYLEIVRLYLGGEDQ